MLNLIKILLSSQYGKFGNSTELRLSNKIDNSQNFNRLSQKGKRKRAKWVNKK